MTTYTSIADASIDPESPITTTLMALLRDNPIAITEGASGAPPIARAARTDPGRLIYISKATLTASASAIFTDLSTAYDAFFIMVRGLYVSSGTDLLLTTSTDNGSTWDSTAYDYHTQNIGSGSAVYNASVSGSAAAVTLSKNLLTSSTQLLDGDYIISGLGRTAFTSVKGSYVGAGGDGGAMLGGRQVSEAVDAFRFTASGNLTGVITLYGIDSGA